MDQLARFSINCHSSIRCGGDTVLWFDPYRVCLLYTSRCV